MIAATVTLWLSSDEDYNDYVEVIIPWTSLRALRLNDITISAGHDPGRDFEEMYFADSIDLRIHKDKISEINTKKILEHNNLSSITINFVDGTFKKYHVEMNCDGIWEEYGK